MAQVDYAVRRSARARNVRVHVDPLTAEVRVVVPARAPASVADAAVAQLRDWIDRRVAEAAAAQATVAARGTAVPYLGATLQLRPQAGRTRVLRRDDRLLVPEGDCRAPLERWFRRAARAEIAPRLDLATQRLGVGYAKLRIGNPRTRWGSCSAKGVVSFNWRLLLAPEAVLDYVVWHEACHLKVPDHSAAFWALVERHVPGHREHSDWLRRNGATLVL